MPDFDDKDLVIFAVLIICIASMAFKIAGVEGIVSNALAGLFGVAVGRKLDK